MAKKYVVQKQGINSEPACLPACLPSFSKHDCSRWLGQLALTKYSLEFPSSTGFIRQVCQAAANTNRTSDPGTWCLKGMLSRAAPNPSYLFCHFVPRAVLSQTQSVSQSGSKITPTDLPSARAR